MPATPVVTAEPPRCDGRAAGRTATAGSASHTVSSTFVARRSSIAR